MVSVILPNYNHAPFLPKRIDSILNQTFQDFEIIILDDASTDDSCSILEAYRTHPKVTHLIINEKNSGSTFSQWGRGIELARGEYIWIAESDDFCEPTLLEELVKPLQENKKNVLSYCQSLVIAADTNKILAHTQADFLSKSVSGNHFVKKHLLAYNEILNTSMVVFRKEAALPFPEVMKTMIYCGDWYFWAFICMKGDVFISGKCLNYYIRHTGSTLTSSSRKGLDFLEGRIVFRFIEETLKLTQEEKNDTLRLKAQHFLRLQPHFESSEAKEAAYLAMTELEPTFKDFLKDEEEKNNQTPRIRKLMSFIRKK